MKRKTFLIAFVIFVSISIGGLGSLVGLSETAKAADVVSGFWNYTTNSTGITITKYTGMADSLVIPSQIDGKTVTVIGKQAFYDNDYFSVVSIPATVLKIEQGAFASCGKLTSVTIPDSVTTIESYYYYDSTRTFGNCTNLKTVIIGNGVQSIPEYCFSDCEQLTSVTIGTGVGSIEDCAFIDCTGLTTVTGGINIRSINDQAFYKCTSLSVMTLHDGLTYIGKGAFSSCTSLSSITIPDSVTTIESDYYYDYTRTFGNCTNLKTVIIGNGVKSIPEYCFSDCKQLTSVTIGTGVGSIENAAFVRCTKLTTVTGGINIRSINDYAFFECTSLSVMILHDRLTYIGKGAFNSCTSLSSIIIPNSVTTIESYDYYDNTRTFGNCTNLKSVTIGNSVTSISDRVFSDNTTTVINGYEGSYGETYAKDKGYTFNKLVAIPATSISATNTELSLPIGEMLDLDPVVLPANSTDAIVWTSSSDSVATVTSFGEVKGKKFGLVNIKATTTSGKTIVYTISVGTDINKLTLTGSNISYVYTGSSVTPTFTLKDGNKTLTNDTDYKVTYKDNYDIGMATATINGVGNYSSSREFNFYIVPMKVADFKSVGQTTTSVQLVWTKGYNVTGYIIERCTTSTNAWSVIKKTTSKEEVSLTDTDLKSNLTYQYSITAYKIVNGKEYIGERSIITLNATTVTAKPIAKPTAKPTAKAKAKAKAKKNIPTVKTTSTSKRKAMIKWTKVSGSAGYVVKMSTSKKGKYKTISTVRSAVTKITKKGLKSKKTYYFKIRSYKKVKGKKVYGKYSAVKSVKIK